MPDTGDTKDLPFEVDFQTCRVVARSGRDVVAAEPIQDGLRIVFDDAPPGAVDYDIVIQLAGYPSGSSSGSAATGRPTAHQGESTLLVAQNSALQKLVESQRSELAADAKTIAQLRRNAEVAANPKSADTESKATALAILDVSGSGTKTTEKFTVAGDWDLNWNYDCTKAMAAVGGQGNFQVFIYKSDGTLSFENAGVNQLGNADSSVEHYHHGGTFYLVLNSEGSWKIGVKETGK